MGKPIPPRDHKVSKTDAAKKTKKYKEKQPKKDRFPTLAFHRDGYTRILDQPGCVGIRAYPGEHEDGRITMILVGVDEQGNDMVDGELAQHPFECPDLCSDLNVLNDEG